MSASQHDHEHGVHEHDLGLSHDLPTLLSRRRMLSVLGGAGALAALAACSPSGTAGGTNAASTANAASGEIPEETAGPFPGDGSNGVNALNQSGIVRSDITRSFGAKSTVAAGIPLTVKLKVVDVSAGGKALTGAAVYLWHCDRDGNYSMYSDGVTDENYLRGVQAADADGFLTFTTIYPGCYTGRWPHMHFEVYPSVDKASSSATKLRTSQLALPKDTSDTVYATKGYEASVTNLAKLSLDSDGVFRDGYSLQLAKVTGSVSDGYVATLTVPV